MPSELLGSFCDNSNWNEIPLWRRMAATIEFSAMGLESDSSKIQNQLRELEADLGRGNKKDLMDSLNSYIDLQILHATASILETGNPILSVVAAAKLQEHQEYKALGDKGLVALLKNKISRLEAVVKDNQTVVVSDDGGEIAVWRGCLAKIQEGVDSE
jgi:hypothetical protein